MTVTNDTPRTTDGKWTIDDNDEIRRAMTPGEPMGTSDILEHVDLPRRTLIYRLNQLADAGEIKKRKLNQTTALWTRPADPEE